jgi:UDP-3-O-[3-hydroxymyristoyl] glucosamine N-acyltransferase
VECPKGKALIISAKPFDTYNKLCKYFSPFKSQEELIGSDCKIDPSAIIFPNVFIGHRSIIGANVIIHAGVCIQSDVVIEENAVIGPNTVIGHDAFYYKKKEEGFDRMHSCGGVKIEKNVEIGASCTIDKGVSGLTIIGEGTKIDNHVHIGHDTQIGKKCLIAAQVGIAGCTIIEDEVTMWGQVGCASGVTIGKKATILAQSGISKSLEGNKTYFGSPAEDIKSKYREMGALRMLPEIIEKMKK